MSGEQSLFKMKPASYWLDARTKGDEEMRWEAIDAIRHLCPPKQSIPLFIDTLTHDRYWRSRGLAAHAIFDLACGPKADPEVVAHLSSIIEFLEDDSRDVRRQIVEALKFVGSPAVASLKSLKSIARSDDTELASLARDAIDAIESQ